jgi:hypothetical protein
MGPHGGPYEEAPMQANRCRRPNLGDLMIFVLVIALGIACQRYTMGTESNPMMSLTGFVAHWIEEQLAPWMAVLTWTALAIRLRKPRPTLRRTCRETGAIASILVVSLAIIQGSLILLPVIVRGRNDIPSLLHKLGSRGFHEGFLVNFWFSLDDSAGAVVAGGWAAAALAGRLRRPRGWIDVLGTFLGIGWVAIYFITPVLFTL